MAVINTTGTFTNNEQVTSTKLNNLIDQAYFESGAVSGSTLVVTAGQLKVGTITSTEMGANSVEGAAIKNGEVTVAKLSTGAPTWTSGGDVTVIGSTTALSSVTATTATVSIGSARTASGASNIDFNSTFPLTSYEARISRESGENGNLVITNTGTGSIIFGTIPLGQQTGTSPIYGARAFARISGTTYSSVTGSSTRAGTLVTIVKSGHGFETGDLIAVDFTSGSILDGVYSVTFVNSSTFTITTTSSGTVATNNADWRLHTISSGSNSNIKSVVSRAGQDGSYAVNMTTAMSDVNYCVNAMSVSTNQTYCSILGTSPLTTRGFNVVTENPGSGLESITSLMVSVFK